MKNWFGRLAAVAAMVCFAGAANAQQFTMKLSSPTVNDAPHEWMKAFKAGVEQRSGGKIKVELYPASQLGQIPTTVEGVAMGTIEFAIPAVGFLIGLTWIVGVVINYLKIDDVRNTWLETHFNWQLRTFWLGLAGMAVAWPLMVVKIGVLIGFAVTVWAIYRVAKGWLALNDRKAMYPSLV